MQDFSNIDKQRILHRQYHIWATAQFLPISQVAGHPHIWYPHISVFFPCRWYCGWKKSCTTWDGRKPIKNNWINHLWTGLSDFFQILPSTVSSISRKRHQKPAISHTLQPLNCNCFSSAVRLGAPWDASPRLGFKIPTRFDHFEVPSG